MMLKGAKGHSQTDALPISNRPHLSERLVGRLMTVLILWSGLQFAKDRLRRITRLAVFQQRRR
jgi:hypothetical protein